MPEQRQQQATELKPCPLCGRAPRIIPTLVGSFYVACVDHCETAARVDVSKAVELWNAGQFDTSCTDRGPEQSRYAAN